MRKGACSPRVLILAPMWRPPSRRGGKTTMLQPFPQPQVERWRESTQHQPDQVGDLLVDVWSGATPHNQLASLKKLSGEMTQMAVSGSLSPSLLLVLVEMYALCLSRHPLQRAIASLLQSLPEPHSQAVTECVHSTISAALSSSWLANHSQRLQFLEALGENFGLGELALWEQLPLVIKYCVDVLESCLKESKFTDPLFITALKTSMSILHKSQSVVSSLLLGASSFQFPSTKSESVVTWPAELRGQSTELKAHWVTTLLERATRMCEEILTTDIAVPHDLTVTAAMLYVVVLLRTSAVECNLEIKVSTVTTNWLCGTGSPLGAFACLSVCHALLAKLPPSLLLVDTEGKSCLLKLFPIVSQLFDSFTETSDRYIAARTLALWTTVAKRCAGMVAEGDGVYEMLVPSGHVITSVLQYVWALWEDPVDGIRHQCNLMFENVIGICQRLQETGSHGASPSAPCPFLLTLTDSLLSLSSPTRGKYQLLTTLSHHLPVTTLLHTAPSLPTELLSVMGRQALACHSGELWSRLVQVHWEEENGSQALWTKTWVDSLVRFMVTASPLSRQHAIQAQCLMASLLTLMFQLSSMPAIALHLGATVNRCSVLTTELACLCCAKSHLKNFSWESWHKTTFIAATHHIDEQMQLSALGILCESHRTTEPPGPSSLPLLLNFLYLNGCAQSPNFRYPMITAVKKLLVRIRDSSYAMRKLYCKKKGPDPQSTIKSYQEFLQSLMSQQFGSLHPFSSYQTRHTALSVLHMLSTIFSSSSISTQSDNHSNNTSTLSVRAGQSADHSLDKTVTADGTISPIFHFPSSVSPCQARRLVDCLRDSYDANRTLVIELLCCLPQKTVGLLELWFLKSLTTSFYELVYSPKAVDGTTASYILQLLLRTSCTQFNHLLQEFHKANKHPLRFSLEPLQASMDTQSLSPQWITVSLLLTLLHNQLERAQEDLLAASVQAPLYGVMQSIRTTLEELKEMSPLSSVLDVAQAVVAEIIQLCGEVALLASPVVCNSSPEGFLPGAKGVPVSSCSSTPSKCGSAQSLLLCCWHAMKETSLLMGMVVEWAPIGGSYNSLLTHKQVDRIASLFISQLTEARHRGAFEMAYNGFQKLCQSLWNSAYLEFQLMPSRWVKELIESLQSKSMSRLLSITRRSAGLPFYLQAILTSEPSHTGHTCLKLAMRALLSVASMCRQPTDSKTASVTNSNQMITDNENVQSGTMSTESSGQSVTDSSSNSDDTQPLSAPVHALNILRALYRDSRLGEHVIPFIPEGVEIAIHGFSAPLWPVRNSSTLLFSALVLRIFGAKRVQNEHSIDNKMTAREFFTRFPTLHGFLLQELKGAAKHLAASRTSGNHLQSLQPSLFPVLLILSRLYPTALDEPASPTSLQSFLTLLLRCTACAVWKTRVLISCAMVPLINPHNAETVLHSLLEQMTTSNQNALHTALLTLHRLVLERYELLHCVQCTDGGTVFGVWLLEHILKRYTLGLRINACSVTRCAYLELVTTLLAQAMVAGEISSLEAAVPLLQEVRRNLLDSKTENWVPVQDDVFISICKLLFLCASQSTSSAKFELSLPQITDLCSECLQHSCVAVRQYTLQYIIDHKDLVSEITRVLINLATIEEDEGVLALLYSALAKSQYPQKGSCDKLYKGAVQLLMRVHLRLELRASLILFLSSVMENSYDTKLAVKWLALVEQYTHPTSPVELRHAVATGLGNLWPMLLKAELLLSVETYCVLVVGLLQDGAEEVREDMATSVGIILSSLAPSVENLHAVMASQNPSPSSALHSYIVSLPFILHHQPSTTLNILLQIVDLDTLLMNGVENKPHDSGNVLFEEDPLNNYMEDVRVLTAICRAVKNLVACHCEHLHKPLVSLAQQLCTVAINLRTNCSEITCASVGFETSYIVNRFSPWDKPHVFLALCKVALLSEAVVDGAVEAGHSVSHELTKLLGYYPELKSALLLN